MLDEHFICPECDSKNWTPRPGETKPLEHLGATRTFRRARIRRYLCRMCGYGFTTIEQFGGPIDRATLDRLINEHAGAADVPDLFTPATDDPS